MEQLCQRLCGEVEGSRRQLAEAQQRSSALTLQLASRNKLVEALQSQLRTVAGGSRGSSGSSIAEATQTEPAGFLLAPPAPAVAPPEGAHGTGGVTADALHSLDRIVGLWREACDTKQHQIEGLRAELAQVGGCRTSNGWLLEGVLHLAQSKDQGSLLQPPDVPMCC